MAGLGDPVVICVAADPVPNENAVLKPSYGPVADTDADTPLPAAALHESREESEVGSLDRWIPLQVFRGFVAGDLSGCNPFGDMTGNGPPDWDFVGRENPC